MAKAFAGDLATDWRRYPRLWLEGLALTATGLFIAVSLHVPESGLFSVCLASAGLVPRFEELLNENRVRIVVLKHASRGVNMLTAASVLALFLGIFTAFFGAALWSGERSMSEEFSFVVQVAHLGNDTMLSRRFGSIGSLLGHNTGVLVVFFGLAFVYRSFGALLALSWNGCVWGVTFAFLMRRALEGQASGVRVAVSSLAVLPHMLLESTGYVLAALGAIFLSKAVMKYDLRAATMGAVLGAVVQLAVLGLLAIAGAAVVESLFVPEVQRLLSS